jgi:general secretion pathway protein I
MKMKTSRNHSGFTLIEVMVALAITIIAFMAMYGSMMQVVAGLAMQQDKTLATWVALDRITEMRVKGDFPTDKESKDEIEMAGITWSYTVEIIPTQSEDLLQVVVRVATADEPDNQLGMASGALIKGALATPTGPGGSGPGGPPGNTQ